MNGWRYAALAMIPVVIACGIAVYDTTQKLAGAMRANRILSEQLVSGDVQQIEAVVDRRTGDVFVRINGEHLHFFKQMCSSRVNL